MNDSIKVILKNDIRFNIIGLIVGHPDEEPTKEELDYLMEDEKYTEELDYLINNGLLEKKKRSDHVTYTLTDKLENILDNNNLFTSRSTLKELYSLIRKPDRIKNIEKKELRN